MAISMQTYLFYESETIVLLDNFPQNTHAHVAEFLSNKISLSIIILNCNSENQ